MESQASRALAAVSRFFRLESAGGLLLIAAAALGMLCANSALAAGYYALLQTPLVVKLGALGVDKPLLLWINDGLMAVFFLLVALELKREMLQGQFSDRTQIALPAVCALGGMLVPMGIYAWLNAGDAIALNGVAIPAATDIAFALGILALLGARVPIGLKLLLTAIAVLDDLGAIVLIALFYTSGLSVLSLSIASVALAVLIALNRTGVARLSAYFIVGTLLWLAVLKSGVHATLAGVALGFTIPLRDRRRPDRAVLEDLEHALHPWVAYAILPIFAFANAGVPLAGVSFATVSSKVPLGIAAGLFFGKPAGVVAFALIARMLGLARPPSDTTFGGFVGVAILCGIGFTMSLFIGSLAFEHASPELLVASRLGVLLGSIASAVTGWLVLRFVLPQPNTA